MKIIIFLNQFTCRNFPTISYSLSHSSHVEFLRLSWSWEVKAGSVTGVLQISASKLCSLGQEWLSPFLPGVLLLISEAPAQKSPLLECLTKSSWQKEFFLSFYSSLFLSLSPPSQFLSSNCKWHLNVSSRRAGISVAFYLCGIPRT